MTAGWQLDGSFYSDLHPQAGIVSYQDEMCLKNSLKVDGIGGHPRFVAHQSPPEDPEEEEGPAGDAPVEGSAASFPITSVAPGKAILRFPGGTVYSGVVGLYQEGSGYPAAEIKIERSASPFMSYPPYTQIPFDLSPNLCPYH